MDYRSILGKHNDAVDPYVRVKLGDKEVDNKKWKKSNTANPEFGHRLSIAYYHPSVANDLVIEVVDDDPGRDDLIASVRLPLIFLA